MEQKIKARMPDFESVRLGLRAWINTTKDGTRSYLVVDDGSGHKTFMNRVAANVAPKASEPVLVERIKDLHIYQNTDGSKFAIESEQEVI